jgi:hypothetical protein
MSFEWLDFVPIWAVKLGIILFLAAILLWMRTLPASYVLRDSPDDSWWRDIRWWACGILAVLVITTVVL